METWKILVAVGGVLALLAGLVSLATGTPLAEMIFGVTLVSGSIVRILGVIGVIGGLVALNGFRTGDAKQGLIGGVLGLLAPCGLSILAVIGGILGMKEAK